MNYTDYSSTEGFKEMFRGHRTTLNSQITPADSFLYDVTYETEYYQDAEGQN